jgi:hypothetical protein
MHKIEVELLINPFCLCEMDFGCLSQICAKHRVTLDAYNLWDLDDQDADELPTYMSSLIGEWRTGRRPGSVYSNVFISGERIPSMIGRGASS